MKVVPLIIAILVTMATVALRMVGRIISGHRPWNNRFALSGDYGDAMTHMLLAEMIRRNGNRLPKRTPEFLLSGPQDYPAFFHWLVALLPKAFVERFEWVVSPFIEGVHAALVFIALYVGLDCLNIQSPLEIASVLVVLWITSPSLALNLRQGGFLNERVFGFLFSHCYLGAMGGWLVTGKPLLLVASTLAGCVVAVSSKFGMQVMIFVTPLAALFLMDFRPLVLLAITALSALILSFGYADFVWRGSIRHTRFYARYLVRVGDYVTSFSMHQFADAVRLLCRGSVRTAACLVIEHPLTKVFINTPAVWISLAAASAATGPNADLRAVLVALVAAPTIVALATTTDALKYLGEGERYLEVAIGPALLLMVVAAPGWAAFLLGGLFIYSALRLIIAWRTLIRVSHNLPASSAADTRELLKWLAECTSRTIYAVPGRLAFPIAYVAPQHRYLWWFINAPERDRQRDFERLFEGGSRYPYPAPQQVHANLGVDRADTVVLHRPTVAACKAAWGTNYYSIIADTIFSNSTYAVMELRGPS